MYLAGLLKIIKNRDSLMFEKKLSRRQSLHHRYSEVSLGPGKQISKNVLDFWPHAAKCGFIS